MSGRGNNPADRGTPSTGTVIDQQYELVSVDELVAHPRNPNSGDVGGLMESIATNDFYGALVVQRSSRYVLRGNHSLAAARQLGIRQLPVLWVDIPDEPADRILAGDNRWGRIGYDDTGALIALLTDLAMTDEGLLGTGYDGDDLDALIASQNTSPEPSTRSAPSRKSFNITVRCGDEQEQNLTLQKLLTMGLDARAR